MKKNYESPEVEIVKFEREDVITTSGISLAANQLPVVTANYLDVNDNEW